MPILKLGPQRRHWLGWAWRPGQRTVSLYLWRGELRIAWLPGRMNPELRKSTRRQVLEDYWREGQG